VILRRRTSFYHKEIENQCIGAHIALIQNTCIAKLIGCGDISRLVFCLGMDGVTFIETKAFEYIRI